ncbi:hypothetical protein GcM3_079013 [Golovinomyces cichoracearum]|uniref:Uncharacterized protein n=1 Tax=Golovinomyces cichoracearum TaxID=62708 RepID=A0A420IPI9_9PEZI|nr:hypothetical protein GcM3_079013 [Golovinomyces cichoracearum]
MMQSGSGTVNKTLHRRSSSNTDHTSASPNLQSNSSKTKKHVVHSSRAQTRNLSSKGIQNPEPGNRKPLRNGSTTSLKKNNSNVNLKRNRSSAEVKPKFAVTFEIGEQEDGWEETSSSVSPTASRPNSKKTSEPQPVKKLQVQLRSSPTSHTPCDSPTIGQQPVYHSGNDHSKVITKRLLSRTQSQSTTHMSLATATPSVISIHNSPPSPNRNTTSNTEESLRLLPGPRSHAGSSQFIFNHPASSKFSDDVKRVQSMKNLAHKSQDEEEFLKLNSYQKPGAGQSRTQQKLWLQRASSIIEPKKILAHRGNEIGLLAGSSYEGREAGIKNLLGRTSIEYLVVRRYQDPVGNAFKRMNLISGMEQNRVIPSKSRKSLDYSTNNNGSGGLFNSFQGSRGHKQGKIFSLSSPNSRGSKHVSSLSAHNAKNNTLGEFLEEGDTGQPNPESEEITILLKRLWDGSPCLNTNNL